MVCYYVYLHKKKTTGEVFYVGKGNGDRAWVSKNRNKYWKNVAAKYGYTVEIYQDNLREWYAFELEQELILKYGRRVNNTGSLCNITTGGEGASGDSSGKYDHTIWTFYNVYSNEEVCMTRYNFSKKYKDTYINTLFSEKSPVQSSKGWVVKEKVSDEHIKALQKSFRNEHSSRADKREYSFVHIDTGEKVTGTKWRMLNKHREVDVDSLVYRIKRTSKRWALQDVCDTFGLDKLRNPFSRSNHPTSDSREHTFTNLYSGEIFIGSRCDLEDYAGVNVCSLFKRNPKLTAKGWCLTENTELARKTARNDFNSYSFVHKDGEVFYGDRERFKIEKGVCADPLFFSKARKSVQGWSLLS